MAMILKQYKPEVAIFVSLFAGLMILLYCFQKISTVINLLEDLSQKTNINHSFLTILLKMTGIAYLIEFISNTCKDVGETAIASKVELAGRILITTMSIPIITTLLEMIAKLL